MACRSGCRTKNHASWGECARDANIRVGDVGIRAFDKWNNNEVAEYTKARLQGIQPEGTSLKQVRTAVDAAERTGNANGLTDNQNAMNRVLTQGG